MRIRKIQAEGIAMMRAGLNKMTDATLFRLATSITPKTGPLPKQTKKRRIQILFLRQHGLCHLCGEIMTLARCGDSLGPRDANIDHYVPRSKGGSNAMKNLRAAHYECNHAKGSKFYQASEFDEELAALSVPSINDV